jgi:hypothetical protein
VATTQIPYPLINGVRQSFVSIEARFVTSTGLNLASPQAVSGAGAAMDLNFRGFLAIDYSRTRSRTIVYGNHPDPLGKTRGKNEYKASFELLLAEYNALLQSLQGITKGYGDVFFAFIITHAEPGFDAIVDTIAGCTLDTTENASADNTDGTRRKVELNPLKIFFAAVDDLAVPLQPLTAQ